MKNLWTYLKVPLTIALFVGIIYATRDLMACMNYLSEALLDVLREIIFAYNCIPIYLAWYYSGRAVFWSIMDAYAEMNAVGGGA